MRNAGTRAGLALCAALSMIAAGCGSSSTSSSPTRPTQSSQTADQGQGQTQNPRPPTNAPAPSSQSEAEFTAQITAVAGACPALRLTIDGRTVVTNASTVFDKLACGQLHTGQTVEIHGLGQSDGSVLADRVHMEDVAIDEDARDDEVTGTLAQLGGRCPTIVFAIGSRRVATSMSTEFKDVSCASLANGDTVEAKGATQPDGSLLASRVERTHR
jgi:hypothetical protein